jgi:site-specific DNA-methyltransferase (adenine-specific)
MHDGDVVLHHGDCLDVMRGMPADSVDAVVCDPPGGISFMSKSWDTDHGGRDQFVAWLTERLAEATRLLKPGGHALVWAMPRTSGWTHRAIEDAGLVPNHRDDYDASSYRTTPIIGDDNTYADADGLETVQAWQCAAGCPIAELDAQRGTLTSGNRAAGSHGLMGYHGANAAPMPAVVGDTGGASRFFHVFRSDRYCVLYGMLMGCERNPSESSATPASTAKSASPTTPETIVDTAPKDATTRSVEQNARHAASAVSLCDSCATAIARSAVATHHGHSAIRKLGLPSTDDFSERILIRSLALIAEDLAKPDITSTTTALMTSLGCAVDAISAYTTKASKRATRKSAASHQGPPEFPVMIYQAKAGSAERPFELDGEGRKIAHPTVKPLQLMQFLVRLVTPVGGLILDPFCGSGTTGEAALLENMRAILIDQDPDSISWTKKRLSKPLQTGLF